MSIWQNLQDEQKRIDAETLKEGKVETRHIVVTSGTGRFTIAEALMFGVAYRQKPDLRVTSEVEQWDAEGLPLVTATVREWITDEAGNYVGAYVSLAML